MPCGQKGNSCQKSCCQKKKPCQKDPCAEATNQVSIVRQGTDTKQAVVQLGCIKYTSILPDPRAITAIWDTTTQQGGWLPIMQDSNGNEMPLNDQESYCVKNPSPCIAKFSIEINNVVVLPPVSLEPNSFIVFTTDFSSTAAPALTFGAASCCDETPCCKKQSACQRELSPLSYQGGRSAGLITCNFPKPVRHIPFFQVAQCPSKCCN
jgi:hypothetical protein